jgi:hypothetical protein
LTSPPLPSDQQSHHCRCLSRVDTRPDKKPNVPVRSRFRAPVRPPTVQVRPHWERYSEYALLDADRDDHDDDPLPPSRRRGGRWLRGPRRSKDHRHTAGWQGIAPASPPWCGRRPPWCCRRSRRDPHGGLHGVAFDRPPPRASRRSCGRHDPAVVAPRLGLCQYPRTRSSWQCWLPWSGASPHLQGRYSDMLGSRQLLDNANGLKVFEEAVTSPTPVSPNVRLDRALGFALSLVIIGIASGRRCRADEKDVGAVTHRRTRRCRPCFRAGPPPRRVAEEETTVTRMPALPDAESTPPAGRTPRTRHHRCRPAADNPGASVDALEPRDNHFAERRDRIGDRDASRRSTARGQPHAARRRRERGGNGKRSAAAGRRTARSRPARSVDDEKGG